MTDGTAPPRIVHVIDRLQVGGMENGLVNLINGTPPERYRHAIVCLRSHDDDFRRRIVRDDVPVVSLNKGDGKDLAVYPRLWRALRDLKPAVVHSRNLPTIDMIPPIVASGVRRRVHGEHGRDVFETYGGNRKYNLLRRAMSPWVDRYIVVSKDIEGWLAETVGIPERKIRQIYNGVDSARFHPPAGAPRDPLPEPAGFAGDDAIIIGTTGRMEAIKDQPNLVKAFILLCGLVPEAAPRLRLVLVGDGSLRAEALSLLTDAGLAGQAWLPGNRNDVPALMRAMDIFVLPSINEGISNTILEAMSCGRPVIATRVGGNPELVVEGETGALVPAKDPVALADMLRAYVQDAELRAAHGAGGRRRIETTFSLKAMVDNYLAVYDDLLRPN